MSSVRVQRLLARIRVVQRLRVIARPFFMTSAMFAVFYAHFTIRRFNGGRGMAAGAACSTLIVTPPTVMVPDRELVPGLAATE